MGKLGGLLAEKYNPFAFSPWCGNHRGNLSLKDCLEEVESMSLLLDFVTGAENWFHHSNKSTAVLRSVMPEDLADPKSLKRAEDLTRWVGVYLSLTALFNLHVHVIHARLEEYFGQGVSAAKKRKIARIARHAFDYRVIVRMHVL
jgi:hypothetical protein